MPAAPSRAAGLRLRWQTGTHPERRFPDLSAAHQQPAGDPGYNSPIPVRWVKCSNEEWCPLDTVKLSHTHFHSMTGVYIIWHAGPEPAVVAIGQGYIRDRLTAARRDPDIQAYGHLNLYVTWAHVDKRYRNGALAYLAAHYKPKLSRPVPLTKPVAVELPESDR